MNNSKHSENKGKKRENNKTVANISGMGATGSMEFFLNHFTY